VKLHRIPLLFALFILVSALLLIGKIVSNPLPQTVSAQNASANEIIIRFKDSASEPEKQKIRSTARAVVRERIDKIKAEVISVPGGTAETVVSALKKNPFVEYIEPNFKAFALGVSDDPQLPEQWGLYKINAANAVGQSAWDITTGSESIKIAILDTGIEKTHSDLTGKITTEQNFTTSPSTNDENGHGTHVAGIAAAATNNAHGVAGSGYNASLLNGKVLSDDGSGYYSWIANGIIWAADQGAHVINLSLGGTSGSSALSDAVNYAWNKGSIVIAAAGNTSNTNPHYPAYYPNALAVAATTSSDSKASFSTYGASWVDVSAPGAAIYSTYKGDTYANLSGTSMASPMVAGVAGLVFAKGECLTNDCVRNQLEKTADQIAGTGTYWKWGRINALRAVNEPVASLTPTLTPTSTPSPTPTSTPVPTPQKTMTVSDITMSYTIRSNGERRIFSTVTVLQNTNTPLSNARVYASITAPSGKISTFSGTTNTQGKRTFDLRSRELGTYTTTVTNVTRSGYTYTPTLTSKSLLVQ
jgi:thermitase